MLAEPSKVALRIRVELDDGRFVMVPIRTGIPPRTQAEIVQRQYAQPTSTVDALVARIQAALDDVQPAQSNSRRLLRDGVDAAQDVAELSYREFPLRLDDTDDEETGSDGDEGADQGWEPRRPTEERDASDDLVVHVTINDAQEAVLTVRRGVSIAQAVDAFVAQHALSPAKRQLLVDHVMAHIPTETAIGAETVVAVVTVMEQDRFRDRIEIRTHDDLVQRLREFSDRNEFGSVQQRKLMASLFVNMERTELSSDRDRCPVAFVVCLDTGSGTELDDVLCDDDLMSMLNVDKVLAFCDRRQVATAPSHRRTLVQAIAASRQPSRTADQFHAATTPCLSVQTRAATFELFRGDDVLDAICTFADCHFLDDVARLDVIADVLRAASRAESQRFAFDPDSVLRFADQHSLSVDRQSRLALVAELQRLQTRATFRAMPAPAWAHRTKSVKSSQSQVFHRLYAQHLIRKRQSVCKEARHQRKPSSTRSVVCERLYAEGLKFLHRRNQSLSAADLDHDELTFRPQINSDIKHYHRRQFSSGRTSNRTQQRQMQYLVERDRQEMSACTFRPEITSDFQPALGPVHERLYRDGQVRLQRQATLQVVAEELRESCGSDPDRLDRIHNHNLYKTQAIASFRKRFHDFDEDGKRLFHVTDYMANSTPRMVASKVSDHLYSTQTQASKPPPSAAAPSTPNPIQARSTLIFRKAVQSRLRRLYSILVHDGVIDVLSALRVKSDQSQIPEHLRSLVLNVVTTGTRQGKAMNFEQFTTQILEACHHKGVLPSEFIQYRKPGTSKPVSKKAIQRTQSEHDVFTTLYRESQTLKERRFVLQYKTLALQSARDAEQYRSDSINSGSATAR